MPDKVFTFIVKSGQDVGRTWHVPLPVTPRTGDDVSLSSLPYVVIGRGLSARQVVYWVRRA